MKKYLIVLFVFAAMFAHAVGSKTLQARLAYATFYAPGEGPYIETYLSVTGKSVVFSPISNGKFQASIEVTEVFSLNNEIKHFDKYNLLSPEVESVDKTAFNFLNQQRTQLANGKYKYEVTIRDKNQEGKPFSVTQDVNINYNTNIIAFSDIELLDSYQPSAIEGKLNKGGYELVPLVNNFYPDKVNTIKFYTEIYNSASVLNNEGYAFSYHIEDYESHRVLGSGSGMQRLQSKPVNALLKEIDISEIPSGNYSLILEAHNRNNELLASRELFFQRSKIPLISESAGDYHALDISNTFASIYTDKDSLAEFIRSLAPISGPMDIQFADNQLGNADLKLMQQFFYSFWEKKNSENPYQGWLKYKSEVDKVNASYNAPPKKGYASDRGRVYLQYGPPNSITKEYNEPAAYPYEIWHYYKLKTQSNKKFVFYNPAIATNDFLLIHSDAIGEPFDSQWELRISKRTDTSNDYDKTKANPSYGKHVDELFNNPH